MEPDQPGIVSVDERHGELIAELERVIDVDFDSAIADVH
jgi:hypothetical protein